MNEPISIPDAAQAIRDGRLAPRDLVEQCLERIAACEDRIHAWVVVDADGARRAADSLGAEAASGRYCGPLHGIPLGIKDIVDVEGLPTRAGSELTDPASKPADAPLAAALRRAGAVFLGKTVTCEFACFDPSPTRNPWGPNLTHTPGGSSSGSAAAVALGMCLGAIGSQTGGSLVRPASYCGVATLKPTHGLVSTDGVVPVSAFLDHPGPIARSVADLDAIYRSLIEPLDAPPPQPSAPPRLGLVEEFFMEEAAPSIRQATETALAKLRDAGATIEAVNLPPSFGQVHRKHWTIMAVGAATVHRWQFDEHPDAFGPAVARMIQEGLATPAPDYAEALDHQRRFRREAAAIFDRPASIDALLMPATDTTAPPTLNTTGDSKFQSPWSYAGLPVVSIPCSVASDGMPAGIQLVGRPRSGSPAPSRSMVRSALGFHHVPPLAKT